MATPSRKTSSDASSVDGARGVEHLCVLIHGLWGSPVHLHHIRDTLRQSHPEQTLDILIPKSNSNYFTYDGIEVGGERITAEVEQRLRELQESGTSVKRISIVGYSLGGLVARYVIGLLYRNGWFDNDRLEPVNFTTFATPHLGVRTPTTGQRAKLWNFLGSRTLSTSGQQMFLVDEFRNSGRHLLDILADPDSIFVRGLRLFKNKSLYANTVNDRSVPFYTSAISRIDPFADLDAIDVHYLPEQGEPLVLLDTADPVSPRATVEGPKSISERWMLSERTRNAIPFYALFATLVPIMVPLFLINAGYQTYQSARRVRLHETGSVMDLKRYRIPLLEETQAVQDRMIERLTEGGGEQGKKGGGVGYLPTPSPESSNASLPSSATASTTTDLATKEGAKNSSPFPTLALTKEQFGMIDHLDAIGFTKYWAHITKVRHTHAAIVVRMPRDSFAEGRVVVKHWANRFEV